MYDRCMTTTQAPAKTYQVTDTLALTTEDIALAHHIAGFIARANGKTSAYDPAFQVSRDTLMTPDDWDAVATQHGFSCVPILRGGAGVRLHYAILRDYRPTDWEGVKAFTRLLTLELES
jgi:hypothetical protein